MIAAADSEEDSDERLDERELSLDCGESYTHTTHTGVDQHSNEVD